MEYTSSIFYFDQWVWQVSWLLRPLKSSSNPAWNKFQNAYYSMPNDCYRDQYPTAAPGRERSLANRLEGDDETGQARAVGQPVKVLATGKGKESARILLAAVVRREEHAEAEGDKKQRPPGADELDEVDVDEVQVDRQCDNTNQDKYNCAKISLHGFSPDDHCSLFGIFPLLLTSCAP